MEQTKYDVFISYSRKDYVDNSLNVIPENSVLRIMKSLEDADITYWIDEKGIYHGDEFAGVIADAIDGTELIKYLKFMFPNKQQIDATSPAAMQKLQCELRGWLKIS